MVRTKKKYEFLIDFLNIAYLRKSNGKAKLENFKLVRNKLLEYFPKAQIYGIADPSTPYVIDQKSKYQSLVDKGIISQVGSGETADYYLIKYCEKEPFSYIITNDGLKDHVICEELNDRIIRVCIINNKVLFSQKLEHLKLRGKQNEKAK